MNIRVFEDTLFPSTKRWEYALANVAMDATIVVDELKDRFAEICPRLYHGFQNVRGKSQVGMLNFMLPVGCNALCPNICYTDIGNWKRNSAHLSFKQLIQILDEFRMMGGQVIRVVGDGEPVLYHELLELCQWVRNAGLHLLLFSNGVTIPKKVVREYEVGNLYFYIKLWSEDVEVQNRLVAPRTPYEYRDGAIGLAPRPFYELYEVNTERVGFQVMASTLNEADARRIVLGPKTRVPLFVEPFIPEGAGRDHYEFIVRDFPVSKQCSWPPRSSYLGVVNSKGELQAGTFVSEKAVSVKEDGFRKIWSHIFAENPFFFESRYTSGCFCEKTRSY